MLVHLTVLCLWEPWEVLKNDGTPYKVFTPFYKKEVVYQRQGSPRIPKSEKIVFFKHNFNSLNVSDLDLLENKNGKKDFKSMECW